MRRALLHDEEHAVVAAALEVTAAAANGAGHDAVAATAARGLQRLSGSDAAAIFARRGSRRFALAAAAGPRAGAVRRHWGDGFITKGKRIAGCPLPPLSAGMAVHLVPLNVRGRSIGALAIAARQPMEGTIDRVRRFARLVAAPIDHNLFAGELEAAGRAAAVSSDLDGTLQAILAGVRRVVPADAAGILVREGDYARVVAILGHPDEALGHVLPVTRDASLEGPLLRGEAVHIDEPDWGQYDNSAPGANRIRGYLGVPLTAGDEVVGILCLDSWRPGAFDAEDLRRACQFGAHVGAALARARTYSLTRAEANALREAALLATHDPASGDIVHRILDGLRRVVTCDGASVLLRKDEYAYVVAVHGHTTSFRGHRFAIAGHPNLETPLVEGRSYLTADLNAVVSARDSSASVQVRGHMAIPLIARGEILGMLTVDSTRRNTFGPEDLARADLFAGYVAAALSNARMHEAVRIAAERDPVTDLYNHRAIHDRLDRELARARETGTSLAVAMLDLDGFKRYNDTHGHPAGDAALQLVASAIVDACREGDLVGRYGGDEFLVVLPGLASHEAAALGSRLREAVAARTLRVRDGYTVPLGASVGVAIYPHDSHDRDALVALADARLYEDKPRAIARLNRPGNPNPIQIKPACG